MDKDKGGTAFIPGTHKSSYRKKRNLFDEGVLEVWESYSCAPGSLLIFSEGVRHTSCPREQDDPRMAFFLL